MTGPEHYLEADQLLAHECDVDCYAGHSVATERRAQVHATLALAASTALAQHNFETGPPQADKDAWYRAASEGPAARQRLRNAEAAEEREFAEGCPTCGASGAEPCTSQPSGRPYGCWHRGRHS